MPRVLIVEDEPAAGRYLRSLIDQRSPAYSVVGIAENGREALGRVRDSVPDLVVTDVKMPVMDGIELVAALKAEFPALPVVIVSGHQEFEYARRALDTGVVDYLLKPVDPHRLEELLGRLMAQLRAGEEQCRTESLARFVRGDALTPTDAFTPEERFRLGIARSGGLPSRFRLDGAAEEKAAFVDGVYVLPGRDSRERIYLRPESSISAESFAEELRGVECRPGSGFRTIVIAEGSPRADQLREAVGSACLVLDRLIVPGLTQLRRGDLRQAREPDWDKPLADRIEFALKESGAVLLERAIRDMAGAWKSRGATLLSIETQLRRILHFIIRKAPHGDVTVAADLEFLLEEALAGAESFDELAAAAWSLAAKAAGLERLVVREGNVPAFFDTILRYVQARYAEPLNLRSLSDTFRISSSYLSKLFRQHAGKSFGEFLAELRIEAAKRLIRESPGMPLKDVAERVGFNDPFYFSRVFKAVAGLPPSDYARRPCADETEADE
jgi:two-component system, response regulator YesN